MPMPMPMRMPMRMPMPVGTVILADQLIHRMHRLCPVVRVLALHADVPHHGVNLAVAMILGDEEGDRGEVGEEVWRSGVNEGLTCLIHSQGDLLGSFDLVFHVRKVDIVAIHVNLHEQWMRATIDSPTDSPTNDHDPTHMHRCTEADFNQQLLVVGFDHRVCLTPLGMGLENPQGIGLGGIERGGMRDVLVEIPGVFRVFRIMTVRAAAHGGKIEDGRLTVLCQKKNGWPEALTMHPPTKSYHFPIVWHLHARGVIIRDGPMP